MIIKNNAMKQVVLTGQGIILFLVLLMGIIGLKNIATVYESMQYGTQLQVQKMQLVYSMRDAVRLRMMKLLEMQSESDPFVRDEELIRFYQLAGVYRDAYIKYVLLELALEEENLIQVISRLARETQDKARAWAEFLQISTNPQGADAELQRQVEVGQRALLDKLNQLVWIQKNLAQDVQIEMDRERNELVIYYGIIMVCGLLLIFAISWLMLNYLRRSHRELLEKNIALENATEVKSRFLATMSHEIRTPMNGVMGIASLLAETPLEEQQKEYVDLIQASGDRLLLLINDILDFSKIEAGHMKTLPVEFCFHELIYECVDMMAPSAQKKGLELILDLEPAVHRRLKADPARMRQVLINLISNAIKFTKRGTVLVHAAEHEQDTVRVTVSDTGTGIPDSFRESIFKPFSQAHDGSNRNYGGTGLGLAISRDLIRVMGGEMGYNSTVGIGTQFWFEFPAEPTQDKMAPGEDTYKRVLVLDDLDASRQAVSRALKFLGYQVELAMNTNNAMDMLYAADRNGRPYDFLLLDQSMPGLDGQSFARAVRRADGLSEVYTVLMVPMGSAILKASDIIGVDATLVKPFKYKLLREVLEGVAKPAAAKPAQTQGDKTVENEHESALGYLLVAEDNPVNQKVIVGMLKKLGYAVRVVENGREAVEAVRETKFDLVLMDCQMPLMDGYEATGVIKKMIHENEVSPIPVIAITANALVGDREKCIAAGMDDFMSKPIKLKELGELLSKWLEGGQLSEQSTA
jgi:signal transduction histidine kinase/DNA-binding response OmpR family regulator